jgi:hypothetical protein
MKRLDRFDWRAVEAALDREGQAVLPALLSGAECDALAALEDVDEALGDLRAELYGKLLPVAHRWNETMDIGTRYRARRGRLLRVRLRAGEQQPLEQNAQGKDVFPLQAAILLTQPGTDFTGGEMVMTEQRPRMQTRPMVVPLQRGDAVVFAVQFRPFKGSKGFYRVNLRHGVSRVLSGERIALDLLFHDA